jgi:hypothetical protein
MQGCMDHIITVQLLLTHENIYKKSIDLAILGCNDVFGPIAHEKLEPNLSILEIQECLKDAIMDS